MKPVISVIIATYNRRELLGKCIRALLGQTAAKSTFEIIIVDDGSTDDTKHYMRKIQKTVHEPKISYYIQENAGPGAARNNGARHARGKYLVFTDSDCEPTKDWIKTIMIDLKKTGADVLGGDRIPINYNKLIDYVESVAIKTQPEKPLLEKLCQIHPTKMLITDNFAIKKSIFNKACGFDTDYGAKDAGEDPDLTYRLLRQGRRAWHASNLVVYHHQRATMRKLLKRYYTFGIADARNYSKYFKKRLFIEFIPAKLEFFGKFPFTVRIQNNTFKVLLLCLLLIPIIRYYSLVILALLAIIKAINRRDILSAIVSIYTESLIQSANFIGNIVGSIKYKVLCV